MSVDKRVIEKTIDFLNKVPIYPDSVLPASIGMKNCNVPSISLLAEDDNGKVCFLSISDKQKTIKYYESLII